MLACRYESNWKNRPYYHGIDNILSFSIFHFSIHAYQSYINNNKQYSNIFVNFSFYPMIAQVNFDEYYGPVWR